MKILADHIFLHDVTLQFIMALAALIIGVIIIIQSRFTNLVGWGLGLVSLALVAEWWPT